MILFFTHICVQHVLRTKIFILGRLHVTSSSRRRCSFCSSMRFCLSASSWRLCSSFCCCSSCWRRISSERSLLASWSRRKSRLRVDSPGMLMMELEDSQSEESQEKSNLCTAWFRSVKCLDHFCPLAVVVLLPGLSYVPFFILFLASTVLIFCLIWQETNTDFRSALTWVKTAVSSCEGSQWGCDLTPLPPPLLGAVDVVLELDADLPLVGKISDERVFEELLGARPLAVTLHQAAVYERLKLLWPKNTQVKHKIRGVKWKHSLFWKTRFKVKNKWIHAEINNFFALILMYLYVTNLFISPYISVFPYEFMSMSVWYVK